jgi:hypothetical protein
MMIYLPLQEVVCDSVEGYGWVATVSIPLEISEMW